MSSPSPSNLPLILPFTVTAGVTAAKLCSEPLLGACLRQTEEKPKPQNIPGYQARQLKSKDTPPRTSTTRFQRFQSFPYPYGF